MPLSNGFVAPRLGGIAMVLAMLLSGTAAAQYEGEPLSSVVDGRSYLGNTPLRIGHRTRGYGEETAETSFGTHYALPFDGSLLFGDAQFRVGNNDTDFSVNAGLGVRWLADDFFTGDPRIFGASIWYDGEDTMLDNYFNQIGVSFERLGQAIDLRLNANFPLEETRISDETIFTGDLGFMGNSITETTLTPVDNSLRVIDFEIAPRLLNFNAWVYGGGYQMDGEGVSEFGVKGGVRGYIYNDLAIDVGVTDDDEFGTNTVVQVIWTPGRVTPNVSSWMHNIEDRMREQVFRNAYVAVQQSTIEGGIALTDATGEELRIVHVDSSAAPGGDGSFENPLNSLDDIQANSMVGDIILAHAGSQFVGQTANLQDAQRFLGEGDRNGDGMRETHFITTSELGQIALPATSAFADMLANPTIDAGAGSDAIVLMGGTMEVENLAEIEVSNFDIIGGAQGIVSPGGVGDVNINRVDFANLTGDAIQLTELTETLADASTRVRFTPTIEDVTFDSIGGDDIDLDATSMEPGTTPIVETITIRNVDSQDGAGVGIRLTETKRAATITNFDWDGGTTGEGALRIQNTLSQGTVTVNGVNTITGGIQNTAGEGYAIRIEGGAAVHNVTGMTITDTGGDSIIATGGTADLNFTGRITQAANANASILSVEGGHDGDMTFAELTAGQGVINASIGDGLQFDDADGTYAFNDNVTITGVAAGGATSGVNVQGDSTGVITLTDATFTNINGDSITFNGGVADMNFTGRIEQTLNAHSILNVGGGHDGDLTFRELAANSGVINATIGDGLQFIDADGTYTFNHNVNISGTGADNATAAVTAENGSTGAITLANATFSDINGDAITFNGGSASMTLTGRVEQSENAFSILSVTGGHTGTLAFNQATGGMDVVNATIGDGLQFNNADGTYNFNSAVILAGGDAGIDIVNDSDGMFSLTNAGNEITNPTGDAVVITNSAATFTFNGDITANNDRAVLLQANDGGSITFANTSTITKTSAGPGDPGISILNNTGGTFLFAGDVTLNTGAGDAIVIDGNTGGSTTFSNTLTLDTTTGDAFTVTNSAGHTVGASAADNTIDVTGGGIGININGATIAAGGINFQSVDVAGGSANGIVVQNVTGGAVNVGAGQAAAGAGGVITGTTGSAILVDSATNVSFNRMNITNSAGGDAVSITDSNSASLTNLNITGTAAGDSISVVDTTSVTFNNLDIDNSTGGNAVLITGATTANLTNVDIDNVTGGNGVLLTNITSASLNNVDVNTTNAAFDGIEVNHTTGAVSSVTITGSEIMNTGGLGIDYNRSATATSRLTLTNNDVSATGDDGIGIDITGSSDANVTITQGNNVANTSGNDALSVTTSGGAVKTVRILVDGNTFENNDAAARAANFQVGGATVFNANITNNAFTNNEGVTGRAMEMTSLSPGTTVRLDLDQNTAVSANAGGDYLLQETAGDFEVVDRDTADARNVGDVEFAPLIGNFDDIPGPVPQPQ